MIDCLVFDGGSLLVIGEDDGVCGDEVEIYIVDGEVGKYYVGWWIVVEGVDSVVVGWGVYFVVDLCVSDIGCFELILNDVEEGCLLRKYDDFGVGIF